MVLLLGKRESRDCKHTVNAFEQAKTKHRQRPQDRHNNGGGRVAAGFRNDDYGGIDENGGNGDRRRSDTS